MPDDQNDDDAPTLDADEQAKKDLRELRKKAKEADDLAAELADYRKKDAFRDAKVDLKNPVGKLLFDSWTGEINLEAITARAEELGCLESAGAPASTGETGMPGLPDGERRSTDERANLHAGGEPETGQVQQPDPHDLAVKMARDALDAGRTESDAIAAGVRTMFERAQAGDPRASWEPRRS